MTNSEQVNPDSPPDSRQKNIASLKQRLSTLITGSFGTHRGLVRMLLGEAEYLAGRVNQFLQPDLAATRRLVFVCLCNINRSAFAEGVATSCGLVTASIGLSTSTGNPAFHMAIDTAEDFGIDLQAHRATNFTDYEYRPGDLLLAMEIRHAHRLVSQGIPQQAIALLGYWATPHRIHLHDPHTLSSAYFRTCFSLIHSAVRELAIDCRSAVSPAASPAVSPGIAS
jgi:protein-tyrosine phosphatase